MALVVVCRAHQGWQVHDDRSSAPSRSSAARTAHREAHFGVFLAFLRSSAVHTAHRWQRQLPHLLQRAMACGIWVASPLCLAIYRGEAVGLDSIARRTNKVNNHGLTGIGTLQQMWEPALPAMRRAGGARSKERRKTFGKHLSALIRFHDELIRSHELINFSANKVRKGALSDKYFHLLT